MLLFLIPLKSPKTSKNWESISRLFERCLRSVCNQTISDFRVIVVCHERPKIEFEHPNVTYCEVELPTPELDWKSRLLDRERKVFIGLEQARPIDPTHIMIVDADDCVSQRLAEQVKRFPQSNGWIIKKGYLYQDGSKFIRNIRTKFYLCCGTSNIIRTDLYSLCLEAPSSKGTENELLDYWFAHCRHHKIGTTLAQKGFLLERLPFAGAVYIQHEDGNFRLKSMKKIGFKSRLSRIKGFLDRRPLTSALRKEFNLYSLEDTNRIELSNFFSSRNKNYEKMNQNLWEKPANSSLEIENNM